tara:strand:- start:1519 stop:2451 length:933 start_codon:yes stop_codon:yes gene_type:complete
LIKKNIDSQNYNFSWFRLEQEFPFELEDSFYWFLSNLEIHRFSFERNPNSNSNQTLFIWLPSNECSDSDKENLVKSLICLAKTFELSLPPYKWIKVKDEDWSSTWKKNWKPDPIGKTILILPAWLQPPEKFSERKIVLLDPGSAFGTGSHPSTRLCIEALDNDPPIGKTVADLGCGSGILSLTALKLGAKCVFSVDTDSLAISATKMNFSLNDFPENLLNVYLGSIEELEGKIPDEKIDLMLCNILAPIIKKLGPHFYKIIEQKGQVILSGFLFDQAKDLEEFFLSLGWKVLDIKTKDKWSSMLLIRKLS